MLRRISKTRIDLEGDLIIIDTLGEGLENDYIYIEYLDKYKRLLYNIEEEEEGLLK